MDKTLIAENSGSLYMKYRYERGEVDGWDLAKGLVAYLRYKVGILDIRAWTKQTMLEFRGQSEAQARCAKRATSSSRWSCRRSTPRRSRALRWHQKQGHVVAIVSGATKFVVRPLAERARHRALPLHAPRGRGRPLHGPRHRAALLRGRQDLLAAAVHRRAAASISRRAGSTPTPSPTCRCSISSATRSR